MFFLPHLYYSEVMESNIVCFTSLNIMNSRPAITRTAGQLLQKCAQKILPVNKLLSLSTETSSWTE